jgi:hypothetical protein
VLQIGLLATGMTVVQRLLDVVECLRLPWQMPEEADVWGDCWCFQCAFSQVFRKLVLAEYWTVVLSFLVVL